MQRGRINGSVTYSGDSNNNPLSFSSTPTNLLSLASFNGTTNGAFPEGGLITDSAGNLYGTNFAGTVFELAKGSATITTLAALGTSTRLCKILLAASSWTVPATFAE